jgi:hypothetical protein
MSKLNDLDNDLYLIPNTPQQITKLWQEIMKRLANSSKVEADILQVLVCSAFKLEEITEGKAAQILNLHCLDFRSLYEKWEDQYNIYNE